ncbi:MAG: hypothetical protein Q4E17_06315 [Synergistes sp.]|nr:hypothetical protein [Synergistes sp.]
MLNNETIGISAEVAIARIYGIEMNPDYEARADNEIVGLLLKDDTIKRIFEKENIPMPIKHTAEGQNPVDFMLEGDKTLSVKTNQNSIGRAAPQYVGQPTQKTYFEYLEKNNIIPGFNIVSELQKDNLADTYETRGRIFKRLSVTHIDKLIEMYWKNMFDCDYLILLYNLENGSDPMQNYKVFGKMGRCPLCDKDKFSFTQTLETWNESNTLKYNRVPIGNFQVHAHRDCFKFRFDIKGIMKLISSNAV